MLWHISEGEKWTQENPENLRTLILIETISFCENNYVKLVSHTFSCCSMFSAFCISVAVVHLFMQISTVFLQKKKRYSAS